MQEGNKKEKWDKPKLVVLTRGNPEEVSLQACKAYGYYDPYPNGPNGVGAHSNCTGNTAGISACCGCSSGSVS